MQKNVIYSTCLSESTLISKVLCGTFSHSHCNLQFQFCKFIALSLHDTIGNYGMVFPCQSYAVTSSYDINLEIPRSLA